MGLKGVCLYAVFRATLPNARLNVPKKNAWNSWQAV